MNKQKHTMDIILAVIAVVLVVFTAVMVLTFWHIGAVPDVLITAVFGACLGEFGFMAWIKNVKERYGSDEGHDAAADGVRGNDWIGYGSAQEDDGR